MPQKIGESYFSELYKSVEAGSLSDDKTKAEAMINYKKKLVVNNETDEDNEGGNSFNYDGFDYDGRNEEY